MCIGMQSGNLFKYKNTSSIVHTLNPLCKILGLFIFLIMIIMCSSVRVICGLSLIFIFIMVISNVSFKEYFKIIWAFRFFLIFIFFISLFFDGFFSSFIIISRVCLAILYFSVLLYTTSLSEIYFGFLSLLRPFKLSISIIYKCFSIFFCFIPFFFSEYDRIRKSQFCRGLTNIDLFLWFKTVVLAFTMTFRKINDVNKLMMFNNFNCDSNIGFKWRVCDVYMIVCHLLVLIFVLIKEVVL